MHIYAAPIANDDKLPTALQQVKAAPFDLLQQALAANFHFNAAHRTPDNTATLRGLGIEYLATPCGIVIGCLKQG